MASTSYLPNRNNIVPWILAGLLLVGATLATAYLHAQSQTGESITVVEESFRQEIIDAGSVLRQQGFSKTDAVAYVVSQVPGITSAEVDPLVSQAFGSGRDVIALVSEQLTYFISGNPNMPAWLRMAENYCTPLLLRGSATSAYNDCITINNVRSGMRECSTPTGLQTGWMQRLGYTPTSAERAFFMESTSPVSGLVTKVRADESAYRSTLGWVDCAWTAGDPDDPYMPQLTNNAPSYLLLVATVTGTVTQAPGGLTFSMVPAGVAGACVVIGSSYTCTVTRPGGSSKNQTLTLTATGVDADGFPGVTTKTVALVYP